MTGFSIDASDFFKAAEDLRSAADRLLAAVQPVVAKGALNVKTGMRADMAASRHFRQVAQRISYDTRAGRTWVEAQVGPVSAGAGDLANIAYFGGVHGGGGTVRDPQENLDDEAPAFEKALRDILGGLL